MFRWITGFLITLFCIIIGIAFVLLEKDLVNFSTFDAYQTAKPSIILDDEGCEIARFEIDKRAPVSYDKLPNVLVKAFVAAEDHAFFKHQGISLRGIIRSALVNLYHRRVVQGASTITQQVARLMFLYQDRTFLRKIQEVFLAFQLERQLSKEQIFELYLNNIYFGRGIYGVQTACKRLWDKSLDQITIEEAATLATVAKSARLYSPLNAPANAKRGRDVVLKSMGKLGFITKEQQEKALKTKLQINDYAPGNPVRLYLQEWVRHWAERNWGKDTLYTKGLKIKTTINTHLQELAEHAFVPIIHDLRVKLGNKLNGGMMSIEASSGQVKVVIGGYDFKQSQYNRAFQAHRQTGSTFKPILYALAMHSGIEMDGVDIDEPLEIIMPHGQPWKPMNWNDQFEGPMTLARALIVSCNTIASKLLLQVGTSYLPAWARMFGITHALTDYPSAALGTAEATVEENVAAFNVFANKGVYVKPYLVEWVKDEWNNKIWECEHHTHRVIDFRLNSKMVNLLAQRQIIARRKALRAGGKWFDAESIGKTGSTNGAATTWFVGATPYLTTAMYVGCDDNTPMGRKLLASRTTWPMWAQFYKSIPHHPKKQFALDPSLQKFSFNWITGKPTSNHLDPATITLLR